MIDKSVSASAHARDGWFTSSFSNGSQTCVEVKFGHGEVLVRDTKNHRPIITMGPAGWTSFVATLTAR